MKDLLNQEFLLNKYGIPQNTVAWQNGKLVECTLAHYLSIEQQKAFFNKAIPYRIFMNKAMIKPFTDAIIELIELDLLKEIRTWNGCFNLRRMKKIVNGKIVYSDKWSIHAWGLAFDIDALWNALGKKPTISLKIVEVFEKHGFNWGGRFKVPDGMHFELKASLLL